MVRAAGDDPGAGDARPRARAHRASGLLDGQPQPRARADRLVRAGNQTQFNRADGAGYEFVADTVLALDPKNPQVAARLTDRVQELARAGTRPARPRRSGAAPRRRAAIAVARRRRHRRPRARRTCAASGSEKPFGAAPRPMRFADLSVKFQWIANKVVGS